MKKLWQSICDWRIFSPYWRSRIWYEHVSSHLRPRNKWLTKKIPRTWVDKDTILEIVVLESLKHYVDPEGEDCMNVINTECEYQREFYGEVRRNYELATQKLVALQKELDAEWDNVPHRTLKDINTIPKTITNASMARLTASNRKSTTCRLKSWSWVVKNRNGLWT